MMKGDLKIDLIEVLVRHEVVPETFLRNELISMEYKEMRKRGIKGKDAREQLASKFYTSIKNIEFILYGKTKGKIHAQD